MARLVALATLITALASPLSARAQEADATPVPDEATVAAALEANVDPQKLLEATVTTNMPPREYLQAVGELPTPTPAPSVPVMTSGPPGIAARLRCAIAHESHGNPGAVNPSSGAAGLLQFLLSTWLTTPQGKAGLSRLDPVANWNAGVWLASQYPDAFNHHWAADLQFGC